MNISDQINDVINNIAEKIGMAADKLYPVLIKQAYVDGVIFALILALSLVCFIVSL